MYYVCIHSYIPWRYKTILFVCNILQLNSKCRLADIHKHIITHYGSITYSLHHIDFCSEYKIHESMKNGKKNHCSVCLYTNIYCSI